MTRLREALGGGTTVTSGWGPVDRACAPARTERGAPRDRQARAVTIVIDLTPALIGMGTILTASTLVWMISVRLEDASIADIC